MIANNEAKAEDESPASGADTADDGRTVGDVGGSSSDGLNQQQRQQNLMDQLKFAPETPRNAVPSYALLTAAVSCLVLL